MAKGEAAKQLFGEEVVTKMGAAAAADAAKHIAAGDFLTAAYSASHAVRLAGEQPWGDEAQQSMASALRSEIVEDLTLNRDASAASRAATYEMLTGEVPWTAAEVARMHEALSAVPERPAAYSELAVVDQMADFLVLGGVAFWKEDEFQEMRRAAIVDFQHRMEAGEEALAADRVAFIDVLQAAHEASLAQR
jgi:hypothetical protein